MAYTPIGAQGTQKKVGYTPIGSSPVKKTSPTKAVAAPTVKKSPLGTALAVGGYNINAAHKLVKGAGTLGKAVLQGTARGISTIGRDPSEMVDPTQTPGGKVFGAERFFGTDQPFSLESETAPISKFVSEKLGTSEGATQKVLVPLMGALNALDLATGGGKKEAIIQGIKTVDNLAGARRLFKDAGVADDVIDTLKLDSRAVATKTDAEAEALIKEATEVVKKTPVPTKVNPSTLEATPITPARVVPTTPVKNFNEDIITPRSISEAVPAKLEEALESMRQWITTTNRRVVTPSVIKTIDELKIKPAEPVTLYRVGEVDNTRFQSWSRVKPLADDVTEKTFAPDEVLVDTTDPRFHKLYSPETQDVIKTYNGIENEVIIKPLAVAKNLPPLPRVSPTITPSSDEVIGSALERYRVSAKQPDVVLPGVAKEASVPTSPGGLMVKAGELLTPISSRLARINPKLKEVLRKFEYDVAQNTHRDSTRILPLLNATKQLSKEESLIFDLARKNGDADVINALAKKYGFEKELREAQRVLDEIYDRAKQVGIEIPYRENYFPRVVKNPKKYVAYLRSQEDWSEIQAMVAKHAAGKGKKYTDLTPEEISGIVNNFLRGFGNKIDLAKPGFAKKRSVEVIDDTLNEFYESSDSALSTYVIRMNDEIEGRKFFGKALDVDEKVLNTQDSIGAYVIDLIQKGELNPQFEDEVADILKARFARGKMNGALDTFRNMEYISTMGSPISAITQIGDLAWSVYDNGLYNTAKALGKSAFGKRANRVTKEDLGIEQITQEFQNQTKTGKALEKVFKLVGMERLDRLGKEALVNAEFSRFKSLAKKNDPKLKQTLAQTFDPSEVPMVMKEFADGKITDSTKLVLFNKLLDFQPVAKSEMPQVYLENPNGRIFYMLKSFTLKQFDIFRREAIDKITSGNKRQAAEGMKNLILLSGAFTIANATADEIKDLILGRDTPPSDRVVDNLWRLLGASKYDVYKARQDGVGQTVVKKILFPTSLFDRAYKDITNKLEGKEYEKGPLAGEKYKLESTQSIPLVGKLYYWWMGRGEQKEQYKAGGKGEFPELPELPKLPSLPKLPKIGG